MVKFSIYLNRRVFVMYLFIYFSGEVFTRHHRVVSGVQHYILQNWPPRDSALQRKLQTVANKLPRDGAS